MRYYRHPFHCRFFAPIRFCCPGRQHRLLPPATPRSRRWSPAGTDSIQRSWLAGMLSESLADLPTTMPPPLQWPAGTVPSASVCTDGERARAPIGTGGNRDRRCPPPRQPSGFDDRGSGHNPEAAAATDRAASGAVRRSSAEDLAECGQRLCRILAGRCGKRRPRSLAPGCQAVLSWTDLPPVSRSAWVSTWIEIVAIPQVAQGKALFDQLVHDRIVTGPADPRKAVTGFLQDPHFFRLERVDKVRLVGRHKDL